MKDDVTSWLNSKVYAGQDFIFAACSGARFTDMAPSQMSQTGSPRFVTMTIGGNDMNFFNIAVNCIYQPELQTDYGLDYDIDPNCTGQCCQAIKASQQSIDESLENDLTTALDDIFDTHNIDKAADFYLYVTGYVHFFNVDTTWCNTASFGATIHSPKLTQQKRVAINNGVQQVNSKYQQIISAYNPPKSMHVGFVDISPPFSDDGGHRFCEVWATSQWSQYYDKNLWFWNLSPTLWSGDNHIASELSKVPDEVQTRFPNLTGTLYDFSVVEPYYTQISEGASLRPLHPTKSGHAAIYQAIVAQLRSDKVPFVN